MHGDSRLIKALKRMPVDRPPVWMMRQAGRYLPEYRRVRKQAGGFMDLCQTPELACEVTLQPLARYELDAAILFSDILTIPDAMGLGLYFVQGEGPKFERPLTTKADIRNLPIPDPTESLRYVCDTIELVQKHLAGSVPLIGFSGSPWTLACYMVEGQSSKQFHKIKHLAYQQSDLMQELLAKLVEAVSAYLLAQVEAGADVLMMFDTWGGILTTAGYLELSLSAMRQVIDRVKQAHPHLPIIIFTKGSGLWLEHMAGSGCDCVSIDWTVPMGYARAQIGRYVALQGNLDPAVLTCDEQTIIEHTKRVLDSYGPNPGHIFNLGHGITPEVKPEAVETMLATVRSHTYNQQ